MGDVVAVEQDMSFAGLVKAEQAAPERGLAGARFAHQAHRLAPADREGDVVENAQPAAAPEQRLVAHVRHVQGNVARLDQHQADISRLSSAMSESGTGLRLCSGLS
jgi:hypothetical protein